MACNIDYLSESWMNVVLLLLDYESIANEKVNEGMSCVFQMNVTIKPQS